MRTLIKDALRVGLVVFISLALLMMRDTLQLSHAVPYKYSLVQWEAENFLAKWLHGLGSLLPGNSLDEQEKIGMVLEYFRLGEEEERLEMRSRELLLPIHGESPTALEDYLEELMLVKEARAEIRNEVEETMEACSRRSHRRRRAVSGRANWGFRSSPPPRGLSAGPLTQGAHHIAARPHRDHRSNPA